MSKLLIDKILYYIGFNIFLLALTNGAIYLFLSWVNFAWQDYSTYSVSGRVYISFVTFLLLIFPLVFGNAALNDYFEDRERRENG